jgi:sec-independent protein translocase protein TatC
MGLVNKKHQTDKQQLTPEQQAEKQIMRTHARDLGTHFLWFVGTTVVAAIIGFEFKDVIQGLLTMQLDDLHLVDLQPAGTVWSTIAMSLYVGLFIAMPLAVYYGYRFLEPLLLRGGFFAVRRFLTSFSFVMIAILYAFMVTVPLALHGLVGSGADAGLANVSTQSFLTFVITNSLVMAALFQLPLIVGFVGSIKAISKKGALWLHAIILPTMIIAGAIATPFTTLGRSAAGIGLVVIPAIVLFEAGLLLTARRAKQAVLQGDAIQEKYQHQVTQQEEPTVNTQPVVATQPSLSTDSFFDTMLQDDDHDELTAIPAYADLPPSMEVWGDEPEPTMYAPRPQIQTTQQAPAPRLTAAKPAVQHIPHGATPIRPFSTVQRPTIRTLGSGRPQQRPVSNTIRPIDKPALRNPHAPQPTVPFSIASPHYRVRPIAL